MIRTQIVRQNKRPVLVIMDYKEYVRLRQIEEDKADYNSASRVKMTNREWIKHNQLKKELGL